MVTVVVGKKAEGGNCRVVTMAPGADEPHVVEFPVPTEDTPLTPGKPKWANYVKGVVQHYKGTVKPVLGGHCLYSFCAGGVDCSAHCGANWSNLQFAPMLKIYSAEVNCTAAHDARIKRVRALS